MSASETGPANPSVAARIARWRVPMGFAVAALCIWLARPTPSSIVMGMIVAAAGEAVRLWASGHIEKGREVTRTGPYRLVRHPLYLGSTIMAVGFVVAARSMAASVGVLLYLVTMITAAVRTEEAVLDARFAGEYSAYRDGRAAPVDRSFSLTRAIRNREHRAVIGLAAVAGLLVLRWYLSSPPAA